MARPLPFYAGIALALLAMWLLLTESVSPGAILLGSVLAIGGSFVLAALKPPVTRPRRIAAIPGLLWIILVEIVRSNNAVARIILGRAAARPRRRGSRGGLDAPLAAQAVLVGLVLATLGFAFLGTSGGSGPAASEVISAFGPAAGGVNVVTVPEVDTLRIRPSLTVHTAEPGPAATNHGCFHRWSPPGSG